MRNGKESVLLFSTEPPERKKITVLKSLQRLQPFPPVVAELVRLVSDERVGFKEVSELIRSDAAVSADVLRVANSPLLGSCSEVNSILHGVVLLGVDRLKGLILTTALRSFLNPTLETPALLRCWRHNLACGILCEELAPAYFLPKDPCYTAGLLHDVGRLALLAAYPADYAGMLDMAERYHVDVNECERGVFGVDHCEAGQWLVREWKFPDEFLEIAGGHHHNGACGQVDKLTIVRLGCQMADAVGFGITGAEAAMSFASIEARLPARAGGRFSEVGDVALKVADRVNALECSLAG